MTKTTSFILKGLYIISWIIFIGLCIDAGGFITNTAYTLGVNSEYASKFWKQINLEPIYKYNQSYYVTMTILISIVSILKAILFLMIINVFEKKIVSMTNPFTDKARKFIQFGAYTSFAIGLFALWGKGLIESLYKSGIVIVNKENMGFAGADVWIFMAIILFVIAFVFKRGIELQSENELTI